MTNDSVHETGPWIDEMIGSAFDSLGLELEKSFSTSTHLYARFPIRQPETSELLVEPTGRGLEMDVIRGPLADIDPELVRRLCAAWLVRRYPIELEATYIPGGLHVRAKALYRWPVRSHKAASDLRAVTVRIADVVHDVSRLARALLRLQVLDVADTPGRSNFNPASPSPLHHYDAAVGCVAWTESGELWAGTTDGTLLTFASSSEGVSDVAARASEDGEIVALAHHSVKRRMAVGTSRGLIVIEPDSTRVQVQANTYVTDVDWDATTGDSGLAA